ncbi:quinone-dependent dihydroorotate dehydrogenase [Magnetovibrio sp. PR-2]|uniref:quinone-dependent dihydroorotate dehydrogenase n=1 Tax=Magnetovibrio sp. PR-2 TaxID=3120356 RepID=UPI002FCE0808
MAVARTGTYKLIWPLVRLLDPERAHALALTALKLGIMPAPARVEDDVLQVKLWDLVFPNPVGLAAGFDKDADVYTQMLSQGFGFVEVGSITPRPQPGNPKPRLFRLEQDGAVINRMGFNSAGHDVSVRRLQSRDRARGIVGVNLGKNKETEDAAADYEVGAQNFGALADYMVINVSSPNTPGLRALQGPEPLRELLTRTKTALDATTKDTRTPPLLLKIAPDLTDEDKSDIAQVSQEVGIDGLIVTNTTIERPDTLQGLHKGETGGLSGRPLFEASTRVLGEMYEATGGKMVLVGVGGIEDAKTAYDKILAGASLVQLYSAMVYQGPAIAAGINRELAEMLKADGFASVLQAVGQKGA